MILGQLRIGARQAKNAPLIIMIIITTIIIVFSRSNLNSHYPPAEQVDG